MSKPVTVTKPIYYRPIERHWYRLVDFVQPKWRRFADSRFGFYVGRTLAILLRVLYWIGGAIFIVGMAVAYIFLSFAFSGVRKRRR